MDDLRQRVGEFGRVTIARADVVTWRDASLGCPEPDMMHAQVSKPGMWLVVFHQGREFDYRTTLSIARLCESQLRVDPLERAPLKGVWSRLADVPTPRSEVAATQLQSKIYVFGGFGRGATANEEYDPASDTWRRRAPIPRGVDHAAAVSLNGAVYLIGGFDGRWGPVSNFWAYDPVSDTWTAKADLPTPRGALGAAVVGGKIFAIGGRNAQGDVGTVEVYDPATGIWTERSPMPTPRDHIAVAVANGKIYVSGGRLGTYAHNLGTVEEYDPSSDSWRPKASLPTPRSGIAAVTLGELMYVFGGEAVEGTFYENERYNPGTDAYLRHRGAKRTGGRGDGGGVRPGYGYLDRTLSHAYATGPYCGGGGQR